MPTDRERLLVAVSKELVSRELKLDSTAGNRTSPETWVKLADRLVSSKQRSQRLQSTVARLRRYQPLPYWE
jgi:hypothetical protein